MVSFVDQSRRVMFGRPLKMLAICFRQNHKSWIALVCVFQLFSCSAFAKPRWQFVAKNGKVVLFEVGGQRAFLCQPGDENISLKSLAKRHRDNRVVRRKGRLYVINKTQRRFKARQG